MSSSSRIAAFNPRYERLLNAIRCGSEKDAISMFASEQYSVQLEIEYVFEDRMMYKVTPLNWAVRHNKPKLCKFLLENGAKPFCNLVYEYYPLHEACSRGFDAIVAIFIEKRCDLNKPTPIDQDTPLHIACMRGNVGCVHLLLSATASPHLRNAAGHTPLEAAVYNDQDDLAKLFAAYNFSKSTIPTSLPAPSTLATHSTHPPIQRRHSLSSPTTVAQKLISSVRPNSRPSSVLFNGSEPRLELRPLSRVGKTTPPSCPGSSPKTSSLTNGEALYTRTTAPSMSPLASITQVESGCNGDSLRPTYMSQFSIASPSSANSPSPVDRDCGGLLKNLTNAEYRNQQTPPNGPQSNLYHSLPSSNSRSNSPTKSLHRVPLSTSTTTNHYNVKTCGQFGSMPPLYSSKSFPTNDIPSVKISQTHAHSHYRRPLVSQVGIHKPSKDSYGLVKPSTHEQHPTSCPKPVSAPTNSQSFLTSQQSGAKSSTNREHITLSIPKSASPMECLTPSPSRERINSLVSCLTSALHKTCQSDGVDTPSFMSQELSGKLAESVNLTREQLSSLVQLALSTPTDVKQNCISEQLLEVPHVTTTAVDHPAQALREVGLNIEDHPRDVRMGEPADGYMSVLFNLRPCHVTNSGATKKGKEVVKVIAQVFNLRDPMDSNLYHSLESEQFQNGLDGTHMQEVAILRKLSPHPCIAQLMSHFKADVSNQYDRFARRACPDTHDELYVTRKVADFIVLSMPCKTLLQYFEVFKPVSFCGDLESKVLSILSQLLLATAHLTRHKISHTSLNSDNVFVDDEDHDTVVIANFGSGLSLNNISASDIEKLQEKLRSDAVNDETKCRVSPDIREVLQAENIDSILEKDLPRLFETSDSYAVAQMVYELVLGPGHHFICELGRSCYLYEHIPTLNGLSPFLNHLLKKLFAYDLSDRLTSMEGALACLTLLFGPNPLQMSSLKECKEWLFAETMEFYLRPSLKDTTNSDYSDTHAKLLCMYLTIANANPSLIYNACLFFQEMTDNLKTS